MLCSTRLPIDIGKRLEVLAEKVGRSKSYLIRQAVIDALEDLEDAYIGEQAYLEYVRSGKKSISHEELGKELGFVDD